MTYDHDYRRTAEVALLQRIGERGQLQVTSCAMPEYGLASGPCGMFARADASGVRVGRLADVMNTDNRETAHATY